MLSDNNTVDGLMGDHNTLVRIFEHFTQDDNDELDYDEFKQYATQHRSGVLEEWERMLEETEEEFSEELQHIIREEDQ